MYFLNVFIAVYSSSLNQVSELSVSEVKHKIGQLGTFWEIGRLWAKWLFLITFLRKWLQIKFFSSDCQAEKTSCVLVFLTPDFALLKRDATKSWRGIFCRKTGSSKRFLEVNAGNSICFAFPFSDLLCWCFCLFFTNCSWMVEVCWNWNFFMDSSHLN